MVHRHGDVQPLRPGALGIPGRRPQRRGLVQLAAAQLRPLRPAPRLGVAAGPLLGAPAPRHRRSGRRAVRRHRRPAASPPAGRDDRAAIRVRGADVPRREGTEFQTRLDGLDRDWSPWSGETRRDFTNLGFGDYRFHVRARNIAGTVSDEATYAFTILPPWYRTWSAYAGYLLLGAGLVFGVDRLQRRRLLGKERERAQFAEARLRAEAAEALARTESEGKKQVELLSDIGREITASLDFDTIFGKLYERVNQLADADVFGVGLYHPEREEIEYRLAIEEGKRYAPYTRDTSDPDQLPVWCIEHRQPVFINDLRRRFTEVRQPLRGEEPAARRRLDVEDAAVAHLPAARRQGPRARPHHHPELREERLHRPSPERDAEPGVVHRHRARQRRRLPAAERAGARDPPAVRGGASGRGPPPRKPTPPRARSCRRSATSCARRSPRCSASPRSSRSASRTGSSRWSTTDDQKVRRPCSRCTTT